MVTIRANDAVLHGLDIEGAVHNPEGKFTGLTVSDTRIRCVGEEAWCLVLGQGAHVRDTEIGGLASGTSYSYAAGVYSGPDAGTNVIERLNAHHLTRGIELNGNTNVLDSYFHDSPMGDDVYRASCSCMFSGAHSSNMFITAGHNMLIRDNSFRGGNSALIFLQDYAHSAAGIGDVTITKNLFTAVRPHRGQTTPFGIGGLPSGQGWKGGPVSIVDNAFTHGWGVGAIQDSPALATSGNYYTDKTGGDPN